MTTPISARPYQTECVNRMFESMIAGNEYGLVALPTGAGKTIIFSSFIEQVYKRYGARRNRIRVCIAAHREKLVSQARDKLLKVWPESMFRIGMACSSVSRDIDIDSEIVICSIQTLLSRLAARGAEQIKPFDIILIDEAHRIPPRETDSLYKKLFILTAALSPKRKVFGFTATPYRLGHGYIYGDMCKEGNTNWFPEITFSQPMEAMIDSGYLVPYRIRKAVDIGPELRRVPIRNGEYKNDVLGDIMCKFVDSAAGVYKNYGEDRKHVVAFCVNIDHAEKVAAAFRKIGITSECAHSKMPMGERARILDDFSKGKIRVLASVDALIEGWDETSVDCLLLLRPTKSPMIYVQQCGRGLRLHEGKKDLLVLDMADNFVNHGFFSDPKVVVPGNKPPGDPPAKACPDCGFILHASIMLCPNCGHVFLSRKVKEPVAVAMIDVGNAKTKKGEVSSCESLLEGKIIDNIYVREVRQMKVSKMINGKVMFELVLRGTDSGNPRSAAVCHSVVGQKHLDSPGFRNFWRRFALSDSVPDKLDEMVKNAAALEKRKHAIMRFDGETAVFLGWNGFSGWDEWDGMVMKIEKNEENSSRISHSAPSFSGFRRKGSEKTAEPGGKPKILRRISA